MREKQRTMAFIDGTNFLVRLSDVLELKFRADKPPATALELARGLVLQRTNQRDMDVIRRYWFGSYSGSEEDHKNLSSVLRDKGFEPVLFKKRKGREKGVDIALTMEMLVNAFNQNFDIGFLFAGDEDYVGLVTEVKRYGPRIYGAFFDNGLSDELKLACDMFSILPNPKATAHFNNIYLQLVSELENE